MPKGWGLCSNARSGTKSVSTWSQHKGLYIAGENHAVAGAWEHENGDLEQALETTESIPQPDLYSRNWKQYLQGLFVAPEAGRSTASHWEPLLLFSQSLL